MHFYKSFRSIESCDSLQALPLSQTSLPSLPMAADIINNNKVQMENFSRESLDIVKTVGTGTFARVCLCQHKTTSNYFALKILSMQDVIQLKQVEHVKNEKSILKDIQ